MLLPSATNLYTTKRFQTSTKGSFTLSVQNTIFSTTEACLQSPNVSHNGIYPEFTQNASKLL